MILRMMFWRLWYTSSFWKSSFIECAMSLTLSHKMKTTDQQGLRHRDYTGPLRNLITDAEDLLESKKSEGIQVGGVWRN